MKLTRLELSGFKSFADSISLPFEEGMTCIVGPNGCGKSNVSDAVRWVLGEQRARMLRGAKMEEVIFQGSLKRKPLNISEVSLCFDNSDGTLPLAYQEVVVTRRLSRNGQSDYLINQAPARLKDVQDLLRGTGLGGDAGVVIEAKMIDRLLSDRPDERRSLFEEAAGIGLYRDRKTTTERRLEKTSEDLIRLDDLISEVQTQVRSLARQRGKAQRHRQFTQERFSIVIELTRRQLKEFEHVRSTSAERHAELERIMPETREAITAREREREAAVQHRATAEAQRREAARRLSERRVEVEKIEGDLNLAKERLQNATQRMSRAGVEREEAERRAGQAQLEHEAAGEERQAANRDRESVQGELDLRSASEDETRARLKTKRDRVRELEQQLQQAAETLRAKTGEESALKAEIEDLRGQLSEMEQRRVEAGQALEEATEFLASLTRQLESLEDEDRATQARLEQARHSVANARENETAILAEKRANEERHTQLSTRCEALEDLERERAGLAPAVKTLLAAREQFGDGAVLGPLSDFLQTDSDQATRAERLLGDWLHAVLVRDDATVSAIRAWHASTEPGPLALLPVHPGPSAPAGESVALQIDAEGPARLWAHALLGGSSALDETGTAIRQANGAILLTGTRDGRGPLARRAELNKLKAQLTDTTAAVERLTQSATAATQAFTSAEENLRTAGEKAEVSRRQVAETRGEVDNLGRERQRIERDCQEKDESIARLRARLDDRESRVQQLGVETNEANRSRAQLEADLESERMQLGRVEAEQETARERRVHWQVEEAQVSAREAAALDRESRAAEAYLESTEEMERLAKEITEIETASAALKEQLAAWTDRVGECRVEVSELETATEQAESGVAEADAKIADAEQRLETARHQLEQTTGQFHRLELQETELAGRRQALLERIEVEFHRPYDELEKESESVEGETAVLKEEEERLAAAIEQLGPVNPLAAQEYDEESTRLNFLETQREDLVDAQNSLRNALKEIDATARQLFDETFNEIRGNFQRVFETLFEGGECDVRLTDTDDPLDADIEIRAAPRGKRTQRIHLLSSGERALVAISLLFAIYLSKPSPFCLLDEVDAPLDDANVQRFIRLLTEFKVDTQFIVITHNPRTMQVADAVYGVTMQEPGVSTIVGVRLGEHQHA